MGVGFPSNKFDIDNRAGSLTRGLRDTFREIESFKVWIDKQEDEDLTAVGYTPEDITLLRASFTDLVKLSRISHAQDVQPAPNDFWWNAGHLTGPS